MYIFRCWQQCSTYNLFENLHKDLLLVETSKLRQKQAKMNFLSGMMHDQTRRVHTQKPGNSGFIQQPKPQPGKFQPRSQGLTEGKCEGADRGNPKSFRLGKTFKITESHQEIQRRAVDEEMERLGYISVLGNQGWAFLVRERIPALSQHTQSPDAFWCYAQKCWNIFLPFPVSDLICSVWAVCAVNSQFYSNSIRSSCNTLTNQPLHFLSTFFFPLSQSFRSVWGEPVKEKAS